MKYSKYKTLDLDKDEFNPAMVDNGWYKFDVHHKVEKFLVKIRGYDVFLDRKHYCFHIYKQKQPAGLIVLNEDLTTLRSKTIAIALAALHLDHQGKGLMVDIYRYLLKSGWFIKPDYPDNQSIGGKSIWKKLNKMRGFQYGPNNFYGREMK